MIIVLEIIHSMQQNIITYKDFSDGDADFSCNSRDLDDGYGDFDEDYDEDGSNAAQEYDS